MRIARAAGVHVQGGQDKGGQGESRETQRGRVGELAVLIWLPTTNLQGTTVGIGVLALKHGAVVGALVAVMAVLAAIGGNVLFSSAGDSGVGSRHDGC